MAKGFFITGTDTDVGKTHVASRLIATLAEQNIKVAGFKPVASGGTEYDGALKNSDALSLMGQASVNLDYSIVNPYCFAPAIAPHLAAEQAGCVIDLARIQENYRKIAEQTEVVIVEGAGGWCVPLTEQLAFYDIASSLKLPVILVVGLKLGCINHALLTAQAIVHSGCELLGWVANEVEPNFNEKQQNIAYLKNNIASPLLACVEFCAEKKPLQALDIDLAQFV